MRKKSAIGSPRKLSSKTGGLEVLEDDSPSLAGSGITFPEPRRWKVAREIPNYSSVRRAEDLKRSEAGYLIFVDARV